MFMCVLSARVSAYVWKRGVSLGRHSWVGVLQEDCSRCLFRQSSTGLEVTYWVMVPGCLGSPRDPPVFCLPRAQIVNPPLHGWADFLLPFYMGSGIRTQDLVLAREALYLPTAISPTPFSLLFLNEEHFFPPARSHYFCEISAPRDFVTDRWIFWMFPL